MRGKQIPTTFFGIFFFILFLSILAIVQKYQNTLLLENTILQAIVNSRNEILTQMFFIFTYLGNWEAAVVFSVLFSIVFIYKKHWRHLVTFIVSVASSGLLIWIIKNIIERPRPTGFYPLAIETDFSFPSGHSAIAVVAYGFFAYWLIQKQKNFFIKMLAALLAFFLILLIGYSRLYLGLHWPLDVLGGYALGASVLLFIISFTESTKG